MFSRLVLSVLLAAGLAACEGTNHPTQTTYVGQIPAGCTIEETQPGVFTPTGDLSRCGNVSIVYLDGRVQAMSAGQMGDYVQRNPPMTYTGYNHGLSDILLYHYLFNSPRAHYYQTLYYPRYRGYTVYRRMHPTVRRTPWYGDTRLQSRGLSSGRSSGYSGYRPSAGFTTTRVSRPAASAAPSYRPSGGFVNRSSSPAPGRSYGGYRPSGGFRSSSTSSYRSSGGFRSSSRR